MLFLKSSGMMHRGKPAAEPVVGFRGACEDRSLLRMPKRRKTSEQVTAMERMMRIIMIHVRPVP